MQHKKTITLALGGARSGKTAWAENHALSLADNGTGATVKPCYLATGQAFDDEIKARINRHRALRADRFETLEEAHDIASVIASRHGGEVVLVDSVGTWITNLMLADADIRSAADQTLNAVEETAASVVFVSDETGLGIVPENAMARAFRDHIGDFNQRLAAMADEVRLLVAGIPMTIKTSSHKDL